jgi:hypothetical protein
MYSIIVWRHVRISAISGHGASESDGLGNCIRERYWEGLFVLVEGFGVVPFDGLKKGLLVGFCPFAFGDGIAAFIFCAISF